MKKLFALIFLLSALAAGAQTPVNITTIPTYAGACDGCKTLTVVNGATRLVEGRYLNKTRLDSIVQSFANYALASNVYTKAESNSQLALKLNTGDTATMLANYKHWLAGYATTSQLSAKVNISDTAAMLANYRHWAAGYASAGELGAKLNVSDTATMLTNYKHWLAGYAMAADLVSKVNVSDTGAMLTNYKHWLAGYAMASDLASKVNVSDTASMLANYKHWLAGYATIVDVAAKVNVSDTAAMLLNYKHWVEGYLKEEVDPVWTADKPNYYTKPEVDALIGTGDGGVAGVASFNGRTGAVSPQSNDYTFAQIGSKPTTVTGYGITDAATLSQLALKLNIADTSNMLTNYRHWLAGYALSSNLHAVATSGNYNDLTNKPTIPAAQVNSDWNASSGVAQILNKPTLGTAAALNVAATGNAASGEVVKGDDTRLTDARTPTSHNHDDRYYTESEVDALIAGAGGGGTVLEDYDVVITGTGADNTSAIQTAITNNTRILFKGASIVNSLINVPANRHIKFAEGASIRIGSNSTGDQDLNGNVFKCDGVDNVTFVDVNILSPLDVTMTLNAWMKCYIRVNNSSRVRIISNKMEYTGTSQYMAGVNVTGLASIYNEIIRPQFRGCGITYSEGGASYTSVVGGYIKKVKGNAIGGMGNDGNSGYGCLLQDIHIDSIDRMGVEDQLLMIGTRMINLRISNVGLNPAMGEGMGISAVGQEFLIDGAWITNYRYLGIETFGNSGGKVVNCHIIQTTRVEGNGSGIIANFTANAQTMYRSHGLTIHNNTIVNADRGLMIMGNYNPQITATKNSIKDAIINAIYISDLGTTGYCVVENNPIEFTLPALTSAGAAEDYLRAIYVYNSHLGVKLNNNNVKWHTTATNSLKYLEGIVVYSNNVVVEGNNVEGNDVVGTNSIALTCYVNSGTDTGLKYLFNRHSGGSASITGTLAYAQNNTFSGGSELGGYTSGGSGSGTVSAGAANRLAYYPSASTTVDDLAAITASRALISDANGLPTHSAVTNTELGYVSGVTSSIQTQITGKVTANTAITGATKTKITYDAKGLVTAGADLAEADVPSLPTSKITSGTFDVARLPVLDAVTNGNMQPVSSNAVYDALQGVTGGTGPWTEITRGTVGTRTSNTTLTNDEVLTFEMSANTSYKIVIEIFFEAPTTPGFKFALTGPASPTSVRVDRWHRLPGGTAFVYPAPDLTYTASTSFNGNANPYGSLFMIVDVTNGANAGTFAFQWAQINSNATPTKITAISSLKYRTL